MIKGLLILALIVLPATAYAQRAGMQGNSSRNRPNPYGSPEIANPSLTSGFEDYRFLVDNNIFSSNRGVKEAKPADDQPKPPPQPPVAPPPLEKNYVLTGVAQDGDQFLAYIEVNNDRSKFISPVGVNDRIGSNLGVVTSIDIDGIEYRKTGSANTISISVGYDLTGEPVGSAARSAATSVVGSSIEEMMKARRKAMESGYYDPNETLSNPYPTPAPVQPSQPITPFPSGVFNPMNRNMTR